MSGVFISYRRSDSGGWAGRLYDRLTQRFGTESIFMDVDDIPPAVDFSEFIAKQLRTVDAMVVIIGEHWATVADELGRSRVQDPSDLLHREIATALFLGLKVIPVLVGGASMPAATDLPDDLQQLARLNAAELSETRFNADVDELIELLAESVRSSSRGLFARFTDRVSSRRPESFWATVPGILTGVAVIITALTGLAVAINVLSDGTSSETSLSTSTVPPATEAPATASPTTEAPPPEPQFVVAGDIILEAGAEVPERLMVSLFWIFNSFESSTLPEMEASTGRLEYSITLEDAPPLNTIFIDIEGVKIGVAYIVAFGDDNGNGQFDDDSEEIVAASPDHAVTYLLGDLSSVSTAYQEDGIWTLLQLPQGYALTQAVPPEEHGLPSSFDDLIPVENRRIDLVILRDRSKITFPNAS